MRLGLVANRHRTRKDSTPLERVGHSALVLLETDYCAAEVVVETSFCEAVGLYAVPSECASLNTATILGSTNELSDNDRPASCAA